MFTKGSMIPVLYNTKGRLRVVKTYCAMQDEFNTDLETGHTLNGSPSEAKGFSIFKAPPS